MVISHSIHHRRSGETAQLLQKVNRERIEVNVVPVGGILKTFKRIIDGIKITEIFLFGECWDKGIRHWRL